MFLYPNERLKSMKILTNEEYKDLIRRIEQLESASTGTVWEYSPYEMDLHKLCKELPIIIRKIIGKELKRTFMAYMEVLEKK